MKQAFGCLLLGLTSIFFVESGDFVSHDGRVLASRTSLSLEQRVVNLEARMVALEGQTTGRRPVGKEQEFIKSLGEGSGVGSNWVKVAESDFNLDLSLYGNVTGVTWQGWLTVKDGNGIGYARIYDATNKRGVDGSEIRILSNTKSSFYSSKMSIWRGINDYYIQVKSNSGYEVSIAEPKLKIVVN